MSAEEEEIRLARQYYCYFPITQISRRPKLFKTLLRVNVNRVVSIYRLRIPTSIIDMRNPQIPPFTENAENNN